MRIVFMGTRDIAIPALQVLIEKAKQGWEIVAVVTQPDRPAGRSARPAMPPVKTLAAANGIPVLQPETLRDDSVLQTLRDLAPDVGIVASYAQLLPRRVLRLPPAGWLNIHPSLLPRHRGPSPVAASVLAGDAVTGVSIIKLVTAMDAGPIVEQVSIPVLPDDTTGSLTARLGDLGAQCLSTLLEDWVAGRITARPQDNAAATHSHLLRREDGLLDWNLPAAALERQVRAFDPWPGTFTLWEGRRLGIIGAQALSTPSAAPPGTVLGLDRVDQRPALLIATGSGQLAAFRLQLEGRKALAADEFVRGQRAITGSQFSLKESPSPPPG
jgi:methionyl-tRNA formyltransferase